ncbi:MAG: XRE family transcriptional regulator [Holophagales bacterium]|jgi:Zn-dependent peptidase ImmA (M78 family)|nr:XRE family transcriptional regulator [Holophagales bacterium]
MSRNKVQGYDAGRLALMLDARRLQKVQLAHMLGVSPATVTKWASGAQMPPLEELARILNVAAEWFTRPMLEPLTSPLFRSMVATHKAAYDLLKARLELAQHIAFVFSEFVDYPSENLPIRRFSTLDSITDEDIENAAAECRNLWRLGRLAIQDLTLAAEGAGIIVIREETGISTVDGLSARSSVLRRPMVLLSADKENGYRSRFDLAHEIGHIVLHWNIEDKTTITHKHHKQMEQQAHRFAGALLLPQESFVSELTANRPTLDDLLPIKNRWGTSVRAIIMRLKNIKLLSDDDATALFKRISVRWGAKGEPGDKDRNPERPRLLRRTVDLLAEQNIMPLDAISQCTGLSDVDVEALAGLPSGYLSNGGNIIPFVRLREG